MDKQKAYPQTGAFYLCSVYGAKKTNVRRKRP